MTDANRWSGTTVLALRDVGRSDVGVVGGKAANLGELSRLEGIDVPDGFCVSTGAFARVSGAAPALGGPLDRLARLKAADREAIAEVAAAIRTVIEGMAIPGDVQEAVGRFLAALGAQAAYAVRSSATAEDLPSASFAGQHDTYLNVIGERAILAHIGRCWASLFSERAVGYRLQHGLDHRRVLMAVLVQKMLHPQASGILFTADPVTGNRKLASIEAGLGLGEALVSGRVNADGYKVRDGQVVARAIASIEGRQVLTDAQIVRLERLGRRIEGHFGQPQDIEWCLAGDRLHIVQSRPITTLYPVPQAEDRGNHVYVSVGHQQMMTDAMRPLGLSLFQLTAARPMYEAGGRLFVDVAGQLASPAGRELILGVLGRSDPLITDALRAVVERGDFIESSPADPGAPAPGKPGASPRTFQELSEDDPAIVADLIARSQASIEQLKRDIRTRSGPALVEFIVDDVQRLKQGLSEPQSFAAIMTSMNAARWINEHMLAWLGEKNPADTLAQSAPHNVTSEMGLALLDVADVIRPHPEVIAHLERARDDGFLEGLLPLAGGPEAQAAIRAYLDRYGMRCAGEIDVTRTRWSEAPTTLVPLILAHIKNFEPGEARRKWERGRREAANKQRELLERLRQLPDGEAKAGETERMISRLRSFAGYREYPKYGIVSRYFVYKQALLEAARGLVRDGVLREPEDIYHLTLQELREVVRTRQLDEGIIRAREAEHERNRRLTPPRVLTSEGEVIAGAYRRGGVPPGALVGLPVSAGVVEGRARVLRDMADAVLEPDDILVTPFTDPSWTPVFVSIKGLVTEVGGLMTHGAVIAREYGLPAVVGVDSATRLIKEGQRLRVHGTDGYVEVLG
jgi:pyruvate,water dikinase